MPAMHLAAKRAQSDRRSLDLRRWAAQIVVLPTCAPYVFLLLLMLILFLRVVNLILMLILVLSVKTLYLYPILDVFAMSLHTTLTNMNPRKMSQSYLVPQPTLVSTAGKLIFLLSMKVFGLDPN